MRLEVGLLVHYIGANNSAEVTPSINYESITDELPGRYC
jgi:hypothetical protein